MRAREVTARRYAKALFLAAHDAGVADAVGRELAGVFQTLDSHAEARGVLGRPWIKGEDRRRIAAALAEKSGAGRLVQNFAGLLAERRRMDHLQEIVWAYRALLDESLGQARATVRSAVSLGEQDKRQLAERLGHVMGKRIILEEQVDSTLLGGFVAQVGSFVLDGSLDGQLAHMREQLTRG
ncbi:MAG: ATP synthase F1 subunit delta [Candidatus Rokuibacteriota bacterium]|nr:MAG: ATP synthase F1 subunit delta [Candidatus Rokubacteria bacterium]